MRLFLICCLFFILMAANSCIKKNGYQEGYEQGRMDAQNECFEESEVRDEMKLEQVMERYRWECARQKQSIINNCQDYCGKTII